MAAVIEVIQEPFVRDPQSLTPRLTEESGSARSNRVHVAAGPDVSDAPVSMLHEMLDSELGASPVLAVHRVTVDATGHTVDYYEPDPPLSLLGKVSEVMGRCGDNQPIDAVPQKDIDRLTLPRFLYIEGPAHDRRPSLASPTRDHLLHRSGERIVGAPQQETNGPGGFTAPA